MWPKKREERDSGRVERERVSATDRRFVSENVKGIFQRLATRDGTDGDSGPAPDEK